LRLVLSLPPYLRGCLGAALLLAACSSGKDKPQPQPDQGTTTQPDGKALWPCSGPGTACNAHDTCVQDAVCREDGLCHPTSVQSCDDGLDCTVDTCKSAGLCGNEPKPGFCTLAVKGQARCFEAKAPSPDDPCQVCDPTKTATAWTAANGGACDDGNPCTKDDYCQAGTCKGSSFSCDDGNACTEDVCDGKGGCSNPPKANICVIDTQCHSPGDKAPGGCGTCDPTKSATSWTLIAGKCFVDGSCYDTGAKAPVGCGTCDPAKDPYHFSPPTDTCDVGSCVAKGDHGLSGCTVCDPAASPLDWSSVAGASTDLSDFESGLGSFTVSAATNSVGWQAATLRPHGGKQSLYYGNPQKKNYDSGATNNGTATRTGIVLPAGQKAALLFWLYMDTEQGSSYDVLTVEVSGKQVWQKDSTTMPAANFKRWVPIEINLWAFAGNTVSLVFKFDTKDSSSNTTEGVYIDDIRILTACGGLPQLSPFVMDGKVDAGAVKVAGGTNQMQIWAAFKNDHLYLATDDPGAGNDNFILISDTAPGALRSPPWSKAGLITFPARTYFLAGEADNSYCGWFKLGDTLMYACGATSVGLFAAATASPKGSGVLEGSINLVEVFGVQPSVVYVAAAAWTSKNSGTLVAQTPASTNSDGNIDAGEILKLSIPGLQVVP
jgi:hypothetical protein